INACTINAAAALEMSETHGTIRVGKKANFMITKPIPSINYIPYAFGEKVIDEVIFNV
ncbi:MAG: amidohydrolase family protein, partial [Chitinophagaceae bacterium]|nr:amidohydrolase family protein [Chitinophagaceae bacterium]